MTHETNPIKVALGEWINATEAYSEFEASDSDHLELIRTTHNLINAVRDAVRIEIPEDTPKTLHDIADAIMARRKPIHSHAWTIGQNIANLSGAFIFGFYSDDDTDAPCDVEWDCENFMEEIYPGYTFDHDEIRPAYVLGTVYQAAPDNLAEGGITQD